MQNKKLKSTAFVLALAYYVVSCLFFFCGSTSLYILFFPAYLTFAAGWFYGVPGMVGATVFTFVLLWLAFFGILRLFCKGNTPPKSSL